jgi:hypothetical protein
MQINLEIQKAFSFQKANDYLAAEKIYKDLNKKYPNNTAILTLYGILKIQTEEYENAIKFLEESLKFDANNDLALANLGIVFFNIKKFEDSINYLNKAIYLNPKNSDYLYHLANSLKKVNNYDKALVNYRNSINLDNNHIQSFFGCAYIYEETNRQNEALLTYKKIIDFENSNIEAHLGAGNALLKLENFNEAMGYYNEALKLDGSNLDALFNLGVCLNKLNKLTDSLNSYSKILKINPGDINTLINRGLIFKNLGLYTEACLDFNYALQIDSKNYGALFNLSLIKLLEGNFNDGFKLYEFRKALKLGRYKFSSKPTWLNNFPITNKILLIHSDQGLGDFIQCYRYIDLLYNLDAKIIFYTPKSLTKIIKKQNPKAEIIEEGEALPHFDFECPIMSLPFAFKTDLGSIPSKFPYLLIDNNSSFIFNSQKNNLQKIGLVWRGSSEHDDDFRRSIDIKLLDPIFRQNFEFHIIQKDLNQKERNFLNQFENVVIHSDNLNNFYDTSLVINHMNFIISVDTSVAHLAGAMNKKTYLLLPFSPDFRWLLNLKRSPWYPSFIIIRQTNYNDWNSAINNLVTNYLGLN